MNRVLVTGNLALASIGGCGFSPIVPRLDIVDVQEPEHPRRVGSFQTDATLGAISGNYVFLINGGTNVEVLDISVPATPVRVASFAGGGSVSSMAADGRFLFIADAEAGLLSVELIPKLLLAPPLIDTSSLTLRWMGGPGIKLQQATTLTNPIWLDVDGTDGQSRIQLPRTDNSTFFRAVQR